MNPLAVAGQHPLEAVVGQLPHRLGLLRPRVPAVVLGRRKLPPVSVLIQVVAGEQESVLHQQDAVALGMAGRRDGEEAGGQLPRPFAAENDLGIRLRRQLVPVDDAAGVEVGGVAVGVGHVVPVGHWPSRNRASQPFAVGFTLSA